MKIEPGVTRAMIRSVIGSRRIIALSHDGECGLYITRLRNAYGTSLAARGTREELEAFV